MGLKIILRHLNDCVSGLKSGSSIVSFEFELVWLSKRTQNTDGGKELVFGARMKRKQNLN